MDFFIQWSSFTRADRQVRNLLSTVPSAPDFPPSGVESHCPFLPCLVLSPFERLLTWFVGSAERSTLHLNTGKDI